MKRNPHTPVRQVRSTLQDMHGCVIRLPKKACRGLEIRFCGQMQPGLICIRVMLISKCGFIDNVTADSSSSIHSEVYTSALSS